MKPVSNDVVEQQLGWRCATKVFDATKKIPDADWSTLEKSLILSPSSYGLQPWKFFVVNDPEIRAKLKPTSWNQSQIVDASHLVVLAIRKNFGVADIERFVARTAEVRGVAIESLAKFQQMMVGTLLNGSINLDVWATHQVYIALGFFMAAAAMLGIDTCPMEGFEPAKYDEILGLAPLGYHAAVVATAGYRSTGDKYAGQTKVRYKAEDLIVRI